MYHPKSYTTFFYGKNLQILRVEITTSRLARLAI